MERNIRTTIRWANLKRAWAFTKFHYDKEITISALHRAQKLYLSRVSDKDMVRFMEWKGAAFQQGG